MTHIIVIIKRILRMFLRDARLLVRWGVFAATVCFLCLFYLTFSYFTEGNGYNTIATAYINPIELRQHTEPCESAHPTKLNRRNNIWQVLTQKEEESKNVDILKMKPASEISIFGAYLDDRTTIGANHIVRMFGISSVGLETEVLCQLWYSNMTMPIIALAKREVVGRGLKVSGTQYHEQLFSCILPNTGIVPVNVSLAFTKCEQSTMLVPVIVPPKEEVHEFGVCVAVSYGKLDPYRLVEWIELNQLLGVGEFNLYDSRINDEARNVLQYYEKQGIVNLRQSTPAVTSWCHWCQKLSVIPAFNDCLYRNMYRYKYTLVIDVDEYLVPHQDLDLHAMIERYMRGRLNDYPAFIVRNAYFFLDFEPTGASEEYLVSTQYLTRLAPSKQGYAPKSIVNPRKCVVVQNHYCAIRTPDVGKYWTEVIPPELALNHHYKKCHYGKNKCLTEMQGENFHDGTVLRYKEQLLRNVNARLTDLKTLKLIV